MRNFPVNINGKEYWVSRSLAVAIFVYNPITKSILAVKRGKGCPDNVSKWCCPCGYLDYDETLKDAAYRELHEETGLVRDDVAEITIDHIDDSLNSNRQNVTIIYKTIFYNLTDNLTKEFSEPDEIDDIKWISIENIDDYDWAFNHNIIINNLFGINKQSNQ